MNCETGTARSSKCLAIRYPCQKILHALWGECFSIWSLETSRVQALSDPPQRGDMGVLNLPDNRGDLLRMGVCSLGVGLHSKFDGLRRARITEFGPPSLCRSKAILRPLGDHVPFLLCDQGHDTHGE